MAFSAEIAVKRQIAIAMKKVFAIPLAMADGLRKPNLPSALDTILKSFSAYVADRANKAANCPESFLFPKGSG
ncbi:MAG: hypothetical protein LBC69_02190 [Eubacteriaceae bacterium]|nr:hypothetical protein [Eubacteriaceae bacterium]